MAKLDCNLKGRLFSILKDIDDAVMQSISATLEEESTFTCGNATCVVRVYERYSYTGQNRVSMNITAVACDDNVHLCAMTSGGSQALFFKFNTFGEESFLDTIVSAVEKYK